MSTNDRRGVRYAEAMELVKSRGGGDPVAEQLVMRAVTLAHTAIAEGRGPEQPLDWVFFVEQMFGLADQRQALKQILAGEDLRWWGEDS